MSSWYRALMAREPVRQCDWVSQSLSRLLSIALDTHGCEYKDTLPPGHHWCLFPSFSKESELSVDGYTQEHAPPPPYIRRVWAGGRLEWRQPIRFGTEMHASSRVSDVSIRGKDDKIFVEIEKLIHPPNAASDWHLRESRTLAYMKSSSRMDPSWKRTPSRILPLVPDYSRDFTPTMTTLFRYSALTYNSHKIHLDQNYTREVEGFPDCLVHGPLTCTLLLSLIQTHFPTKRLTSFSYRALSPLFVNRKMTVNFRSNEDGLSGEAWAMDAQDGRIGMKGTFSLERLDLD